MQTEKCSLILIANRLPSFCYYMYLATYKTFPKRQSPPSFKRAEEEGGWLHRRHKTVWGGRRQEQRTQASVEAPVERARITGRTRLATRVDI